MLAAVARALTPSDKVNEARRHLELNLPPPPRKEPKPVALRDCGCGLSADLSLGDAPKVYPSPGRGCCGLGRLSGCLEGSEGEVMCPGSRCPGQPIFSPPNDDRRLFQYQYGFLFPCLLGPSQWKLVLVCVPRQRSGIMERDKGYDLLHICPGGCGFMGQGQVSPRHCSN